MKRINNRKGFTMAELLVVVAIIAVLVAVSIPIFTSKLERAREATDIANMRAAKAAAVTAYLSEDPTLLVDKKTWVQDEIVLYFNAEAGKLQVDVSGINYYGKGTKADGGCEEYMGYTKDTKAQGSYLVVTIKTDGTVSEKWNNSNKI